MTLSRNHEFREAMSFARPRGSRDHTVMKPWILWDEDISETMVHEMTRSWNHEFRNTMRFTRPHSRKNMNFARPWNSWDHEVSKTIQLQNHEFFESTRLAKPHSPKPWIAQTMKVVESALKKGHETMVFAIPILFPKPDSSRHPYRSRHQ